MKYDVTQKLFSFSGEPIRDGGPGSKEDEQATLKKTLEMACINASPQEFATADAKYGVFKILQKIHNAEKTVDLTSEDVVLLKKLCGIYPVAVVGALFDILEKKNEGPRGVAAAPAEKAAE